MLKKTFCHIDGISIQSEKILWENGIEHWDDFFAQVDSLDCLPQSKLARIRDELPHSQVALEKRNIAYFKDLLNPREHWRLLNMGRTAYVDIETSGLSRWSEITVIGIYDGIGSHFYVNGINLAEAQARLDEYDIIVTFNGKQFDLPFIERHFSRQFDFAHLDLRYMLREIGLQGGLKSIEGRLGIARDADVQGMNGLEAVHLWQQYKRGHRAALGKLLKYNEQDILSLKTLLEHYLENKQAQLFGQKTYL